MNLTKPENIGSPEWEDVLKSIRSMTEHFPNLGLFLNWVDEEGKTQHHQILLGNAFALENQIGKWVDGDFDSENEDDDLERAY